MQQTNPYVALNTRKGAIVNLPADRLEGEVVRATMAQREMGVAASVEINGYLYALATDGKTRIRVRFCPLTGRPAQKY